jgi:hypothetical protein
LVSKFLIMKTIEFKAGDGNDYLIPVKSVTCLSPDTNQGGTWVELTSGTRLHTKIEMRTLTKMLKGED